MKHDKELVLMLIRDDLVISKLMYGLTNLGIQADAYLIDISTAVFKLMGLEEENKKNEAIYYAYVTLGTEINKTPIEDAHEVIENIALKMYNLLLAHSEK